VNYNPHRNHDDHSITIAQLKELARGRWVEILMAAGVPAELLESRKGRPCPKCGGDDRFAPMPDVSERGAVLCRTCLNRTTTPRAGDGLASLQWWLECSISEAIQWLKSYLGIGAGVHRAIHRTAIKPTLAPSKQVQSWEVREYLARYSETCYENLTESGRDHIASLLGVSAEALKRLRVGWCTSRSATTWPMRDGDGNIIGIRLRSLTTSDKWSAKDSHAGLFYDPIAFTTISNGARGWVVEGASDAAALLTLGLDGVGVPSSGCGGELIAELGRRILPSEWVIVADNDSAGIEGAKRLRSELLVVAPVRILTPPNGIKDLREWLGRGLCRIGIEREADGAEQIKLEWNRGAM